MTQEDKNILLQDLCSRLPYGVKCEIKGEKEIYTLNRIEIDYENGHLFDFKEQKNGFNMQVYSSEVKPYLFPLDSMTDEQKEEWKSLVIQEAFGKSDRAFTVQDFYNINHIDCKGLIPTGLANNATGLGIYEQ